MKKEFKCGCRSSTGFKSENTLKINKIILTTRYKTWSRSVTGLLNPYPTAFPYGNGTVLHFYQQQESSTTKTVHKVINKGLKTYV